MRAPGPVKEVRHVELMGEELAACLHTLKATRPRQFEGVERALEMLIPGIEGIGSTSAISARWSFASRKTAWPCPRALSEGTLRMLGLLSLTGAGDEPALVGFKEPENGIHPSRIQLIAELLNTRKELGRTQYIVTTHSPILPDLIPGQSLFAVHRSDGRTRVDPFPERGMPARGKAVGDALDEADRLRPSERILRGDFNA